jgi:hypothetical protein
LPGATFTAGCKNLSKSSSAKVPRHRLASKIEGGEGGLGDAHRVLRWFELRFCFGNAPHTVPQPNGSRTALASLFQVLLPFLVPQGNHLVDKINALLCGEVFHRGTRLPGTFSPDSSNGWVGGRSLVALGNLEEEKTFVPNA